MSRVSLVFVRYLTYPQWFYRPILELQTHSRSYISIQNVTILSRVCLYECSAIPSSKEKRYINIDCTFKL